MLLYDMVTYTKNTLHLDVGKIKDTPNTLFVQKYNMVIGEDNIQTNMGTLEKKVINQIQLDYTGNKLENYGDNPYDQYMGLLKQQWESPFLQRSLKEYIGEFMPAKRDRFDSFSSDSEDDYYRGNMNDFLSNVNKN
jgi:hypothetical protein